jgi:hypothetical protein
VENAPASAPGEPLSSAAPERESRPAGSKKPRGKATEKALAATAPETEGRSAAPTLPPPDKTPAEPEDDRPAGRKPALPSRERVAEGWIKKSK